MTATGFEMPKPVLAIEGLTVSFDGFKAVDDLNLYIDRNEVRVKGSINLPMGESLAGRFSAFYGSYDGNIRNVAVQDQCWARLPGHLGLILDGTTFDGVNDALKGNTVSMNCWAI